MLASRKRLLTVALGAPSVGLGELPLQFGGLSDVLDLHTFDPLRRRQPRGAGDLRDKACCDEIQPDARGGVPES